MRLRLAPLVAVLGLATVAACASGPNYKYKKPTEALPAGTGALPEADAVVEEAMKKVAASPLCGATFGKMFKTLLVVMKDIPDVTFSGKVENGACTFERGTKAGVSYDYVLPADKENILGLALFFDDGVLAENEAWQLHSVLYVAGLQSGFRADAFYREDVARYLAFPNIIHFTLKNPQGFEYRGSKAETKATAMNVDGQWIVVEGHRGDAAATMEVTVAQVEEYAALVFGPSTESEEVRLKKVKAFFDTITTSKKG